MSDKIHEKISGKVWAARASAVRSHLRLNSVAFPGMVASMFTSRMFRQALILILYFTVSLQSRALHEKFRDHYEAEKKKTDQNSVPFERVTQLYSKASRAHVQVIGKRVDALGQDGSPYGKKTIFAQIDVIEIFTEKSPS